MIVVPLFLIGLFVVYSFIDTRKAILIAVLIRPVIDCFWSEKYSVVGIKPTELLGFILPTLIFIKIVMSHEQSFTRAPLSLLWIVYIYFQLFGTVLIMSVGESPILAVDYFYRAFNGFIGFYLFQVFFRTRVEFRALLIAHIVAGIFPLGVSVYQNVLGGTIRSEATIAGLMRNIGFYHDAYTLRLYCFQTLAAVLLYWCYFLPGYRTAARGFLLLMAAIATLSVYKLYSKAGYLVIAEWLLVWYAAQKKFLQLGMIVFFLAVAGFLMRGTLTTLDKVYSNEVGVMEGKEGADRMFAGRVGAWRRALEDYPRKPVALQLVGDGSPHTGAHNDFLRALLGTGVIGLLFYCALLGTVGTRTVLNCLREQSPLNIMAVMLIGMWLVDAMGLVPGAYPGYQIFVWGFIGLALRGVEGLTVPGSLAKGTGIDVPGIVMPEEPVRC
jgi:hypothetical protein